MKKKQVKHNKRFCPQGHDTHIVGRLQSGQCIQCNKDNSKLRAEGLKNGTIAKSTTRFCPYGHDTFIVGRNTHSQCRQCHRERYRIDPTKDSRIKIICVNGHDTSVVGRDASGQCNVCAIESKRRWQDEHSEELKIKHKKYYQEHKKEMNEYLINKRKTDPIFKLKYYLRTRLRCAIKTNQKKGSAVRDLGCTVEFFKEYIESKFYSDMTWDNWGKVWELDHVIPLFKFDLADRKQFLKAVNFKNLQPLTIKDHKKKTALEKRNLI